MRTGADGGAVVLLPNKSKIWIKESSALEIEQRQTLTSRLALLFGKMKVRVPHLMRKEKFEVRTPAAVCAVRGTEFTVETADTGAMSINVLYGEVKLSFVIPPDKGGAELFIPQGRNLSLEEKGKPGKLAMMTAEQEKSSLENWNPGLSPAERQKDQKEKDNDRAQLREFAKVTNGTENSVKTFLNTVRESDIETGRTLKDIHGNVVRVAQLLMRPHSDEIQFVNLVKRPSYNVASNYSGRDGFTYNGGPVGNRLDYVQMTMNFNQDLPQNIGEWPGFFSGNSVKPEWASFVAANKTKKDEIFFIAQLSKYDAVKDELVNNGAAIGLTVTPATDREVIVTGVIKDDVAGISAVEGLNRISRQEVTDSGSGLLAYKAGGAVGGTGGDVVWARRIEAGAGNTVTSYEKKGDPNMSNYSAQLYYVGDAIGNGAIWLANESYVINNNGSLQKGDDLVNSSLDPFSLMKNMAGESIMSVKKSKGVAGLTSANVFSDIDTVDRFAYGNRGTNGTNIDIVVIPDLLMAAVQRMLPALTKLD